MKNVYDLRQEKKLYFILPDDCVQCDDVSLKNRKIAIIVHLYYVEGVDWYFEQLSKVPQELDVYVISAVEQICQLAEKRGYHVIKKENRGRDVSALLVSARKIIEQYEYICFLHDKTDLNKDRENVVKLWIENLWFNSIASSSYIKNVVNLMQKNPNIGLLVPPEPIGREWSVWGIDLWRGEFEETQRLCKEWQLNCNISKEKPPITIGTVFWCKVKALKKLFDKEWDYTDFPPEPLGTGKTISHAIERIFAYVAQDAGYDTGTILTNTYAEKQTLFYSEMAGKVLGEFLPLENIKTLEGLERKLEDMKSAPPFLIKRKRLLRMVSLIKET